MGWIIILIIVLLCVSSDEKKERDNHMEWLKEADEWQRKELADLRARAEKGK